MIDPELLRLLNSEREPGTDDEDQDGPAFGMAGKRLSELIRETEPPRSKRPAPKKRPPPAAPPPSTHRVTGSLFGSQTPLTRPRTWELKSPACVRCGSTYLDGGEVVYGAPEIGSSSPGAFFGICAGCCGRLQRQADRLQEMTVIPDRQQAPPAQEGASGWQCPKCGRCWAPSTPGCPRCNS